MRIYILISLGRDEEEMQNDWRRAVCHFTTYSYNVRGGMKGKIEEVCEMSKRRMYSLSELEQVKNIWYHHAWTLYSLLVAYWSFLNSLSETEVIKELKYLLLSHRMYNCVTVGYDCVTIVMIVCMCNCGYESVSQILFWLRLKLGLTRIFIVEVLDCSTRCALERFP